MLNIFFLHCTQKQTCKTLKTQFIILKIKLFHFYIWFRKAIRQIQIKQIWRQFEIWNLISVLIDRSAAKVLEVTLVYLCTPVSRLKNICVLPVSTFRTRNISAQNILFPIWIIMIDCLVRTIPGTAQFVIASWLTLPCAEIFHEQQL